MRVWRPTGFWSLVILPADNEQAPVADRVHTSLPNIERPSADRCDRLLSDGIDDARRLSPGEAYEVLDGVRTQCPGEAGPLREMAAVRFAESRWRDAEDLAERATELDATDAYAWEVLASSRFMQDDRVGALDAWNRIGKPLVNLLKIDGLERSRFQTVATAIGLWPNVLLTEEAFRLAERRLQELPGHAQSRLTFQPEPDGYVTVTAAIVERSGTPRGVVGWGASGLRTVIDREVRVAIPGASGQGEMWSAGWRWWSGRPRVDFGFTAPRHGRLGGVWRVDASWESQRYGATPGEERTRGALSHSDWLAPNARYSFTAGIDSWRGASFTGRTVFAGGSLERRWSGDRWSLGGTATLWAPPSGGTAFHAAGVRGSFRSTRVASGWVYLADVGFERASDSAPLAVWPRAGEGRSGILMRAHPLIEDGIIDPGNTSALGRTLAYTHAEAQRWIAPAGPARIGVAGFADVGRASRRREGGAGHLSLIDVGAGLRVQVPGFAGTLRMDFAGGLLDDEKALTVGWQF
jgi:hypothetical protein